MPKVITGSNIQKFEIIVIDDCSSDSTVDSVRSVVDHRIKLIILDKNSGAQAARNKGIKEAKGDWIAFQDSDDEWNPRKLECQVESLRQVNFAPMTVVHCNCWVDNHQARARTLREIPRIDGSNVFSKLLICSGPLFPGILTSKEALEKIGFLDENIPSHQEWDTSLRLAKYCRFIHLKEPLFTYYLHEGKTISKDRRKDLDGYQYIVSKFKKEVIQHCGISAYNDLLLNNALNACKWKFYKMAEEILDKSENKTIAILVFIRLLRLGINPSFYFRVQRRIKKRLVKFSLT